MKRRIHASSRASALLIVLWAILVMSICVLGLVGYLHTCIDETTALKKDSRARQLAESGVAMGMHPQVARDDPLLHHAVAPGEGFDVTVRSEGSRININYVIQRRQWIVLQRLLADWNVEATDIANVTSALQHPDITNQALPLVVLPSGTDNQITTGIQFQDLDQMLALNGMSAVAAVKPDWRDSFTVWSDGPLDISAAPADLIAAVTGEGDARAEQFVEARNGPDGIEGTDDDIVFTDLNQARVMLGMSEDAFNALNGLVSIGDSTVRIESTGVAGNYRRKIMVVARRNINPPAILVWQEQ